MCLNACDPSRDYPPRVISIVRMRRLLKRRWGRKWSLRERRWALERKKMVNLKLFLENKCIMAENERLRAKAFILCQENQALLSQLLTNNPAGTLFTSSDGGLRSL